MKGFNWLKRQRAGTELESRNTSRIHDDMQKLSPSAAAERGEALRTEYDKRMSRGDHDAVGLLREINRLEGIASVVRGRHYVDWVGRLNELRSSGQDDKALSLLLDIVEAAERAAKVSGHEPAPGYTRQAAIIYRRHKNYDAEVKILERWLAACPPRYRGSASNPHRITVRLLKAKTLQERANQ